MTKFEKPLVFFALSFLVSVTGAASFPISSTILAIILLVYGVFI